MNLLKSLPILCALLGLLPVAVSAEPVTFVYQPPAGAEPRSVSLRGSMNGWGETPLVRQDDGSWTVTVDLPEGEHLYKYFIDGEWPSDMAGAGDGGPLDPAADGYVDDGYGGQNAVRRVGGGSAPAVQVAPREAAGDLKEGQVRIHYHRPDGNYAGWGLHVWEDTPLTVEWTAPLAPTGQDDFGLWWDVPTLAGGTKLGFIVHKGDEKDPGPDMFLEFSVQGREVWLISGRNTLHPTPPDVENIGAGDLSTRRAHWISRDLVVWPIRLRPGTEVALHVSPTAELTLTREGVEGGERFELRPQDKGLPPQLAAAHPHLRGSAVFRLDPAAVARAGELLKGQLAVSLSSAEGRLLDATGVQIPGVLDDLFATTEPLGPGWEGGNPVLRVWAPTAQRVRALLFRTSRDADPFASVDMLESGGVWRATGVPDWKDAFYLFEVTVFQPASGLVETNRVTDPYSRSLAMNSTHSQIVDLDDPRLLPAGWKTLEKPPLEAPEDIVLYELHIRDFSALAEDVPPPFRGTTMAFTVDSAGSRHLRRLAAAGLSHVHLLPAFDIATVQEDKTKWKSPGDLSVFPPDSDRQQAAIMAIADEDPYNWGYDPYHFGVPEGSYSTDPDGSRRIFEFRSMVQALGDMGLRVVMDVVYNHTHASGNDPRSVFDRIVPGYYHRLSMDGAVETSTCCQNTASEHLMMRRFMVDDVVHWARDYKVDGFRFDLMGHHMKEDMIAVRDALRALTPEKDGVDGASLYLYGEGWDFGEVAGGARGVNATQGNMAGTGIGTFNDRIRDAVRGGNPFGDRRDQGFATGLYTMPSGFNGRGPAERGKLLESMDRLRVGLAGNLRDYRFVDRTGREITGGQLSYGGYAAGPSETINYVSAHDNETLFDKIAWAAAADVSLAQRGRMQQLALSTVLLGQGIPFLHAGSEILRSKSMDADSYNSGDWFNHLDFTLATDNFGVGLPPAEKNRDRWDLMRPLLARADLRPGREEMEACLEATEALLRIRRSSPLFRLRNAAEIQRSVRFLNTGPSQVPGMVVMGIQDPATPVSAGPHMVVIFNATPELQTFGQPEWQGASFGLHPIQASGRDAVVKTAAFNPRQGTFSVPALTTAVFVAP